MIGSEGGVPGSFVWCPRGGGEVSWRSRLLASPRLLQGAPGCSGDLGLLCPRLLVVVPSAPAAQRGAGKASAGGGVRGLM